MRILVTGSAGFVGGYIVSDLLAQGYSVRGVDNFSKYGKIVRDHDSHPNYEFVEGDCKDIELMKRLAEGCDVIIAGAAMIGGISYFHEFAYDLLAENERILAATFDAAIHAHKLGMLKRIVAISSSMVFESTKNYPTREGDQLESPPPLSTYGFQKLAAEYFAKGALEQHKLPYTIVRPFNCVGIGEGRALSDKVVMSGNIRLALSHVLPDLAQKALKGQTPLRILGDGDQIRHYTHGKDLARGIRLAMESPKAVNEDFNISTDVSTSVTDLAHIVWEEARPGEAFALAHDPAFQYDVQRRVPDVTKAQNILGFKAEVPLRESVGEVIDWMRKEVAAGRV